MEPLKSTRLNIVEQSLADILERLAEIPASARARELKAKARSYEKAVKKWPVQPPSEDQRAAMLRCVIDLNVEVIETGRKSEPPAT